MSRAAIRFSSTVAPRPQLPTQLVFRLTSMITRHKGREESRYGPIDKLLNLIFCKDIHMVKPQGPIKEEAAELDIEVTSDLSAASIIANLSIASSSNDSTDSIDSYGFDNGDKPTLFPDFIVYEYSASGTADKAILVIKVKKEAGDLQGGVEDLIDYIDIMGNRLKSDSGRAHGVVIAGHLSPVQR